VLGCVLLACLPGAPTAVWAEDTAADEDWPPFAAHAAAGARRVAAGQMDRLSRRLEERRWEPHGPVLDLRGLVLTVGDAEEVPLGPEEGMPLGDAALFLSGGSRLVQGRFVSDGVTAGLDWSPLPGMVVGVGGGWTLTPADLAEDGLNLAGRSLSAHLGWASGGVELRFAGGVGTARLGDPWDAEAVADAGLRFAEAAAQTEVRLITSPGGPDLALTPRAVLSWSRADATDGWGDRSVVAALDVLFGAGLRLSLRTLAGELEVHVDGSLSRTVAARGRDGVAAVAPVSERLHPALRSGVGLGLPSGGYLGLEQSARQVRGGQDQHEVRLILSAPF